MSLDALHPPRSHLTATLLFCMVSVLPACGQVAVPPGDESAATGATATGGGAGAGGAGAGGAGTGGAGVGAGGAPLGGSAGSGGSLPRCAPVAGAVNPRSIAELVDMLNGLPRPLEMPCFVASLSGRLELAAALSRTSAQLAYERHSPRLFIFLDPLILTLAFDGTGRDLLEMGELRGEGRTLKAELAFPLVEEVSAAAPFEHTLFDGERSTCFFCHANERVASDIPFTKAFESVALRPSDAALVNVDFLRSQAASCNDVEQPYRCALLRAVFEREAVEQRGFPPNFLSFD